MMPRRYFWTTGALSALILCAAASCSPGEVAEGDWPSHGRDLAEQRFSPLTEIEAGNIDRLALAWSLDLPDENALEATPIEVGGKLFFSGGFGRVYGVDAVSGKLDWTYDGQDTERNPDSSARIYGVNRGVAYSDGKVFHASRDGRMIALDAKSGKVVWETPFLKPEDRAASTGAPRMFGNNIIIGSSGGEYNGRGFVTALDGATGKILWRWYIVPGNPAVDKDETTLAAAKSWSGRWWEHGGGGHAWNGITFDKEFNQILIGTGNGDPWNCFERSDGPDKSNLYVASVVALDASTGKYKWHYQYNPRECWDWKATADIVLADLKIDGKDRKALIQAPSNGFLYVIDRTDGKIISAEKYGKANWADRIDLKSGLPVERPGIRYETAPATIYPGPYGAHSWQATAFNPQTGLVYIPYMQTGVKWERSENAVRLLKADMDLPRLRQGAKLSAPDGHDPMDWKGALIAWDPVRQKQAWRIDYPYLFAGGVLTTKTNLVFQGTIEGFLYAYDAKTGKKLWSFNARNGIIAPPITYEVNGRQYLSVLVGPGGGPTEGAIPDQNPGWKFGLQPRRLLTFAIDGKAILPETPPPSKKVDIVDVPNLRLDPVRVKAGFEFYELACTFCHGAGAVSAGGAPDLRGSAAAADPAIFRQVVKEGALVSRGMPKIRLSDDQLENVYQYIRSEARLGKKNAAR